MTESLRKIKTMRDIKGPRETLWSARMQTTNALTGIEDAVPYNLNERLLIKKLEEDRLRFAEQERSIGQSRKKLLMARSKLKGIKERNKKVHEQRKQLMMDRFGHERHFGMPKRDVKEPSNRYQRNSVIIEY